VKKSTSLRRRDFLGGLGALALAPNAVAAMAARSPISVTAINHAKIRVTDPARSLEWYQSLFGLPIVARQGTTVILRIGEGPQFLAIDGESSRKPGIVHMGLSVDSFDANQVLQTLKTNDQLGPIKARIHTRGPELGGAPSGTPELFLEDPDGITVQLQDTSYCGCGGKLGDKCSAKPKPSRKKGLLNLRDYNHFTVFVGDQIQTVAFYRRAQCHCYAWDQAISFSPLSVLAGRGISVHSFIMCVLPSTNSIQRKFWGLSQTLASNGAIQRVGQSSRCNPT
jgi:catechol 2,3-dioxygenase-like lactoylglutathione lyase family enzyme